MLNTEDLMWVGIGSVYVVVGVILVFVAKIVKDFLTSYKIDAQLTQEDNPALGLATTGYFLAVIIVFLGASVGQVFETAPPLGAALEQLGVDVLYALAGIVALNLSRLIADRLLLYKFSLRKEIIDDRNVGAGAVEAGALIASALVVAGAIHGEGGPLTALAFYGLGQAVLVIFGLLYQWVTRYDIHKEIEADNAPAGVAMGLNLVAIGTIMLKACSGDFEGWGPNLARFGLYAVAGFVVLAVLRKVIDWVLLPGTTIRKEIVDDKSMNAAFIEGALASGVAAMIFFMF